MWKTLLLLFSYSVWCNFSMSMIIKIHVNSSIKMFNFSFGARSGGQLSLPGERGGLPSRAKLRLPLSFVTAFLKKSYLFIVCSPLSAQAPAGIPNPPASFEAPQRKAIETWSDRRPGSIAFRATSPKPNPARSSQPINIYQKWQPANMWVTKIITFMDGAGSASQMLVSYVRMCVLVRVDVFTYQCRTNEECDTVLPLRTSAH